MECFVLLLLFLFLVVMTTGAGFGAAPHGQGRAYERLTQRFGGVFERGGLLGRCSTRFRHGEAWFCVSPGSRNSQPTTQLQAEWPDMQTDWQLATRGADVPTNADHQRECLTGDDDFHRRFLVLGCSVEESQRLLSDGVRWQINRLACSPRLTRLWISIRHGQLTVEKSLTPRRVDDLEEFTQLCVEFYDQALLTRSEGIEFLGEADQAVPVEEPVCPICCEKIVHDMVYCRRCYTPHHLDCWQYNGLCTTFGCRETRYCIPTVGQPVPQPPAAAPPDASAP